MTSQDTFLKVSAARARGFNVRKTEDGWQAGRLTIDGWNWEPVPWPTRARALKRCYNVFFAERHA